MVYTKVQKYELSYFSLTTIARKIQINATNHLVTSNVYFAHILMSVLLTTRLLGEWEGLARKLVTFPVGWLLLLQLTVLSRSAIAVYLNFLWRVCVVVLDISIGVGTFS